MAGQLAGLSSRGQTAICGSLSESEEPEMSLTVPLLYSGEKTLRSFEWGRLVIALSAISAMMFST